MTASNRSERIFPHDRLDAYVFARDFHRYVISLRGRMPKGTAGLFDQLYRASTSQMLNLAEGADIYSPGRKREHFKIATGSGGECGAVLDAVGLEPDAPADLAEGRRLLVCAVALTVGLIKKLG